MILRIFTIAIVLLMMAAGTELILHSLSWFAAALAFFLYGEALRWIAFSPLLSGFRRLLGLSSVRAMQLWAAARFLSGGGLLVAAIIAFKPVLATIVAVPLLCWMWFWGYAVCRLPRFGCGREPRVTQSLRQGRGLTSS